MTVSPALRIDTQHDDIIHDIQLDYYSKKLATCSSDKSIRIFEIDTNQQQRLLQILKGHDGPVWQVAWAHPKFGSILASCSYDGRVILWKEEGGKWNKVKEHTAHSSSVNAIAWAPETAGLVLACAASDGKISILRFQDDEWTMDIFDAHQIGANTVAWGPVHEDNYSVEDLSANQSNATGLSLVRLASGGCDNLIKFWRFNEAERQWVSGGEPLEGHMDWIRDIAWAPSMGLPVTVIASCSQDKQVIVWTSENNGPYSPKLLSNDPFPDVVWKVSWSPMGLLLAVSYGDDKISIWKQTLEGEWTCQNALDEKTQSLLPNDSQNL